MGLAQFTDEKVRDPKITEMMRKITVYPDPRLQEAGGNEVTAKIQIDLKDGRNLERLATLDKGTGQKWIDESELAEKFRECAQTAFPAPRAEQALACVLRLEELEAIGELTDIIGKGKNDG